MMNDAWERSAPKRRAAFFLTAVAAAGLLCIGVFRKEFAEAFHNAVLICLSCIGIG